MRKINILDVRPKPGQGVYVYEFPVRIWHWTIVTCIFALFITGHFIGSPPQSLRGDPTYLYYFGYLVMVHYTAGLILALSTFCRILWAFRGNAISRQIFIPHVWEKSWWAGFLDDIKWYLFINKKPSINMGHNPLAQLAMLVCVLGIIFMCLTGLGICCAKGYTGFFQWFGFMKNLSYDLGGNGLDLVVAHRMGMVILVMFVMCHIYMVVREEIMGETTMISTMVNGVRLVKATPMRDMLDLRVQEKAESHEKP